MSERFPSTTQTRERYERPTLALENARTPEDFLRAIDFNVLNDIFDQISNRAHDESPARTSGYDVSPARISWQTPSKDRPHPMPGANSSTGEMHLVWRSEKASDTTYPLEVLLDLVHEATHIRSSYIDRTNVEGPELTVGNRTGLAEFVDIVSSESADTKTTRFGISLNEAVTETLALEVLREYLRRTGESVFVRESGFGEQSTSESYFLDQVALATIIQALSRKLTVDRDAVWKGIVHAYMSGSGEIKILFKEIADALEKDPRLTQVLVGLAGSTSLEKQGGTRADIATMIGFLDNSKDRDAIYQQVINVIDAEKFGDVLGLR